MDPVNARKVKDMILDRKWSNGTIFLTTHDMATADELCDRVAFVVDGQIVGNRHTHGAENRAGPTAPCVSSTAARTGVSRPPRSRSTAWPTTQHSTRCCATTTSKPSTAAKPASPTSSWRSPGGGCRDSPGKRTAPGVEAPDSAGILLCSDLLRTHLAGGAVADACGPPPCRRALHSSWGIPAIIGFFFVAGTVFFEKQERTLGAVISTPLRFWEYLSAKLALLTLISLFVAVVVPLVSHDFGYHPLPLVVATVLGTLLMLLVGFTSSLPVHRSATGSWSRRFRSR